MLRDFTISNNVKTVLSEKRGKIETNNHLRILDIPGHFIQENESASYSREVRCELTHLNKDGFQIVYHHKFKRFVLSLLASKTELFGDLVWIS